MVETRVRLPSFLWRRPVLVQEHNCELCLRGFNSRRRPQALLVKWYHATLSKLSRGINTLIGSQMDIAKNLQEQLSKDLDLARRQKGLSIRALAKEAHTSSSQIQRVLKGDGHSFTLRTLFRVAQVLDLDIEISIKKRLKCQ